jgi:hypothetical protein
MKRDDREPVEIPKSHLRSRNCIAWTAGVPVESFGVPLSSVDSCFTYYEAITRTRMRLVSRIQSKSQRNCSDPVRPALSPYAQPSKFSTQPYILEVTT